MASIVDFRPNSPKSPMALKKPERQHSILEQVRANPSVRLASLADRFAVTKETIRRDIDELAGRGLLARTYGGAVASPMNAEPGLSDRELLNPGGRRRMALAAVELLSGSAIVMLDAGSTVAHVCEALAAAVPRAGRVRLTVITNSLRNCALLGVNPAIRVMVAPGDHDAREQAVFGRHTLDFLARFRADVAVTSVGGIAGGFAADANSEAVAVKRAMLAQADRRMLVVEHAKFDNPQFERVAALGDFTDLVTDAPLPEGLLAAGRVPLLHVAG
jgi:DeoR/GlpR family transcriptional regulator of sugar metabolism